MFEPCVANPALCRWMSSNSKFTSDGSGTSKEILRERGGRGSPCGERSLVSGVAVRQGVAGCLRKLYYCNNSFALS